jgi:membrane-associated phospholipid phosphatase
MRRLVVCAASLGALAVVLFLVSQTGGLPEPWGSLIGQHLSRTFHFLFLLLSILFLLLSTLRSGESRIGRVLWTAGAVALNFAVVETLKHIVFWPRPVDVGQNAATASRGSGFPSGHTVPDFLVAVLVGYLEPRLQVPALVAASLVGYSRAEVTAHFPIQVWISALIGIALGLLWTRLFRLFLRHPNPRPESQHPIALP